MAGAGIGVDNEDAGKKTGTQSIERAISILRLFSEGDEPRSLTEVARTVGLNPATTHRILASLVRERLLANDASSERYQMGPDSLFLFAAAARRYGVAAARTELEALAAATHESAAIGALDGADAVIVLQVESDLPLRFSRPAGTRVPAHVSAIGKAILAAAPDVGERVEALGALHRFTDHTITDGSRLLEELAEARERGWAANDSERWSGVRALAVPIDSGAATVTVALGLQAPADRMPDSRIPEAVAALQASARRLSLHLPVTTF